MDIVMWAVVVGASVALLVRRSWDKPEPRREVLVNRLWASGSLWRER